MSDPKIKRDVGPYVDRPAAGFDAWLPDAEAEPFFDVYRRPVLGPQPARRRSLWQRILDAMGWVDGG